MAKRDASKFFAICGGTRKGLILHNSRMAKRAKPTWYAREWRKHAGLNLEKAADRLGMAISYLSDLEKGKRRFNQDHLYAMAEAYNCQPADLIMRDPSQPGSIWSIWDQIPAQERDQAVRVLETFMRKTGTGN